MSHLSFKTTVAVNKYSKCIRCNGRENGWRFPKSLNSELPCGYVRQFSGMYGVEWRALALGGAMGQGVYRHR